MSGAMQDVRFALRGLHRTPGFTAIAIVTLGLGIGANAAMFGIVDRVLLKPLPYRDPEELVQVIETWNGNRGYGPPSWADFLDWRREARSFAGLAGYSAGAGNLTIHGDRERVRVVQTTANIFDVLGVSPALGRGFAPGEDSPSAPCVAVIGDPIWRSRFGADPKIVGTSVALDGTPCAIVGVAAPRFEFPPSLRDAIWLPLHPTAPIYGDRSSHFLATVGRLRKGTAFRTASAEIDGMMRRIARVYPDAAAGRSGRVVPLHEWSSADYRTKLLILSAAVAVVLVVACVNVASMLLARATTRRRELAIRAALGASRARLVRQMLVESAVLAVAGGSAGILVAAAGLRLLEARVEPFLRGNTVSGIDARTLVFGLAASGATILLFGLLPALRAARAEGSALRGEMAVSVRSLERLRGFLVSAEIALSLVLLSAALLLTRTLIALGRSDPGIATDHRLTFKISPPAEPNSRSLEDTLYAPLRRRLAEVPGITGAGTINRLPLEDWGISGTFLLDGRPAPRDPNDWYAEFRVVSPGFFGVLGGSMLRGRDLSDRDTADSPPVAVVNEQFVRRYLGGSDPVGARFRFDSNSPAVTIVGEYASIRQRGLGEPAEPEIDFAAAQIGPAHGLYAFGLASTVTFVLRTSVPPESLVGPVRRAVGEVDPNQPPFAFRTMDEVRARSLGGGRFALTLTGAFAAIALLLCLAGIHGVMSYFVARRSRDIGIRMALGATRRHVLGLVLRAALVLAGAGVAFGVAGSVVAGEFFRSLLFGVQPGDPATLAASAVLLLATALAAAAVPAYRAARVDPVVALRQE